MCPRAVHGPLGLGSRAGSAVSYALATQLMAVSQGPV